MGNYFQRVAFLLLLLAATACSTAEETKTSVPMAYTPIASDRGFIWPLRNYRRTSREFNMNGLKRNHEGIDIPAPTGTPIYNVQSGRVVYAGRAFHGYGNMVLIEHDVGMASIYGHLSKILVKSGQFVDSAAVIGLVGKTGRASAPHLHFEMRLNKKPVNPKEYLP